VRVVAERSQAVQAGVSRVLVLVLGVVLVVYAIGVVIAGVTGADLFGGWLGMVTGFVSVAVCVGAVLQTRHLQWQVLLGAAAVIVYTAGDAYYLLLLDGQEALPGVSAADIAYYAFYPFMLGALAHTLRNLKDLAWPLLLDSVVGALAAASVMVLILTPVLRAEALTDMPIEMVIAVGYPLLDLLLIAAVGGALASQGLDLGPRWPLLIVGLVLFTAADVAFALGMEEYAVGSVMDAGWVAGIASIAVWVDGVARSRGESRHQGQSKRPFIASVVSKAVALGVLLIGCQVQIPLLAQLLAASTLALAALPLVFRNRLLVTLATTDELTGLPNRRGLRTHVSRYLRSFSPGALLFLDLDRFKDVNDALGHDVGDALLVQVGERFAAQLRSVDVLARLGGDEFAVFLDGASKEEAVAVAQRLGEALAEPIQVGTASLKVSVSVGIALTPANGTDMSLLMRKADIAMFRAKGERTGHHLYSAMDDDGGARKLRMLEELRLALVEGQFELHYQPKVRLADQAVTSVEALIRWNHPVLGQLPPVSFLPLAEEAGLMPELTTLVLTRAISRAGQWHSEGMAVSIAVNMSGSCIHAGLARQIVALLEQHSIPPEYLMLEITEDVLIATPTQSAKVLAGLRAEGIQISIDDFGTGYSSLAYLRDLPVDELKLDRSFITAMGKDQRAYGLVGSIIDLAHSLDLRVVAEGVDSRKTLEQLTTLGCDLAQGFHFAKPMPASDVVPWITAFAPPFPGSGERQTPDAAAAVGA
jgi:diguanylate cyclase (GGDEF)-like protein